MAIGRIDSEAALEAFVRGVLDRVGLRSPTRPPRYLSADRPPAASKEGLLIYVPDGAVGAKYQGSDGTSWVALG